MIQNLLVLKAAPNNGMHPTADTLPVIFGYLSGRRVMPGVRRLRLNFGEEAME